MLPLHIYSIGDYCERIDGEAPELKALVQQTLGCHVRRVGRFIQLALIGAGRCARDSLPRDTAVFLASGRGDLEVTMDVLEQLFVHAQPPKPLSFINTVSNAACYYIAQQLELESRSGFVCNRYFAFESALQLAISDFERGVVSSALVGAVDMVVPPATRHRKQLGLIESAAIAEASHWLWLRMAADDNHMPLGKLISAEHHVDRDALVRCITKLDLPATAHISFGQFVQTEDAVLLRRALGLQHEFEYRTGRGYYDSQSGAAISAFIASAMAASFLVHVNADPTGRYSSFVVQKAQA
jgi:hypothetical protein